jgi:hypothetical protein
VNDPLDTRITDALHRQASLAPDPAVAHAEFVERRRLRRRRLQTGVALAAVLLAVVAVLALAEHHKPKVALTATARTTEPQPAPGETVPATGSDTTVTSSSVPGPTASTITSGTAVTTSPTAPPTTAKPTPSTTAPPVGPGPQPPGTVVVTEADSGKSYTLLKGDRLVVQLHDSSYEWTEPASSNDTVLHRTGGSGGTSASATFSATAPGSADVTSTGDLPCRKATPPCMAPSRLFQVSVTVVG